MTRWATFDCYGTLIDWERGIADAFAAAVSAHGGNVEVRRVIEAYKRIEPGVEAERYRSYREVLTESALRVAREIGWALSESSAGFLAKSLPSWPPFSDTNPALERLAQAGFRLGILSNVDDDLLAGTRRRFTVPFDLIVTAQQVRSYKPADGHFLTARNRIGGKHWLHAAQSHFHDVVPCRRLGIPVAWINRRGQATPEGQLPDRELRTLEDLADWLT
jgi:2-haloalkanoic acid dehalogenase type II